MQLKREFIPRSRFNIKATHSMQGNFIVIHNTANDASARNEIAYMTRNNNYVSFHIAVDDIEAIQAIPFNRNSWAEGDGTNGRGNRQGISIEICYSKSGGVKFDRAEENAAKITAQLLKENNWGIDKVKKHQDFSGKYCPHRTLDRGWNRFLKMIEQEMGVNSNIGGDNIYYSIDHNNRTAHQLQKDLISLGYSVGSYGANGWFGNDTKSAVEKFQRDNKLSVDGSAGPSTLNKIKELLQVKEKPVAPSKSTAEDKLARISKIINE